MPPSISCRRRQVEGPIDESMTCPPTFNLTMEPIARPIKLDCHKSMLSLNESLMVESIAEVSSEKEKSCYSSEESLSEDDEVPEDTKNTETLLVDVLPTEKEHKKRKKSRRKLRSRDQRKTRKIEMDTISELNSMNNSLSLVYDRDRYSRRSTVFTVNSRNTARSLYVFGAFLFVFGWTLNHAYNTSMFTTVYQFDTRSTSIPFESSADSSLRRRVSHGRRMSVSGKDSAMLEAAQIQQDIISATIGQPQQVNLETTSKWDASAARRLGSLELN